MGRQTRLRRSPRGRENAFDEPAIAAGPVPRTQRGNRRRLFAPEPLGRRRGPPSTSEPLIDETLELGNGMLLALDGRGQTSVHSTERACPKCGRSFETLDPKKFSYNSPQGWCPRCRGFGELFYLPDVDRGARADAIEESWFEWQEGRRELCPECQGARLNPLARAVRLELPSGRWPIGDFENRATLEAFSKLPVQRASEVFRRLKFKGRAGQIARDILPEIRERLKFLREVGLGYLQLGRGVPTLSGGEAQRIRLAAQLGSNLSGVLYILDEPTIGLHAARQPAVARRPRKTQVARQLRARG